MTVTRREFLKLLCAVPALPVVARFRFLSPESAEMTFPIVFPFSFGETKKQAPSQNLFFPVVNNGNS